MAKRGRPKGEGAGCPIWMAAENVQRGYFSVTVPKEGFRLWRAMIPIAGAIVGAREGKATGQISTAGLVEKAKQTKERENGEEQQGPRTKRAKKRVGAEQQLGPKRKRINTRRGRCGSGRRGREGIGGIGETRRSSRYICAAIPAC